LQILFSKVRHKPWPEACFEPFDFSFPFKLDKSGRAYTLIYINLEEALYQNTDGEFHVKVAQCLDEACKLLDVDIVYVTDMNGAKRFRKRK